MHDEPINGSVPAVPRSDEAARSPDGWTVRTALLAATVVFGGGQLLALGLLQGSIGWLLGWDAVQNLGAADKLAPKTQQWLAVGIQLVVTIVELGVVWRLVGWGGGSAANAFDLRPVRLGAGEWAKVVALTMAVKLGASAVIVPFSGSGAGSVTEDMAPFLALAKDTRLWLAFLAAAILAALLEEIVFRGILSRTLEATALGFWGGALVASGIFAAVHIQYGLVGQFVVFALGMLFSWLRARYASLWPAVVAHALNNAVALIAMKVIA